MRRKPYPSDLTDAQWGLLDPLLPPARPGGRPRKHDLREVLNALFYLNREGCSWRALPHDFPPWKTVYNYFRAWTQDGTWDRVHEALRQQVRRQAGRDPAPRSSAVDSQSVKTAGQPGPRGFDSGKKVNGRKRHLWVDSMGLLLAVLVSAADVHDARAACDLLHDRVWDEWPRLGRVYADSMYTAGYLQEEVFDLAPFDLVVVCRPEGSEGWVRLPQRWVVERTFAWLGRYRRNSKDYERLPESSEAMIRISMIHVMTRRLARAKQQRFHYKRPRQKRAA
jgi:putative transposase